MSGRYKDGAKEGKTSIRPELLAFVSQMEMVLRANEDKGGGWTTCSEKWLLMRLRQEVEELSWAIDEEMHMPKEVMREAVDVANFAMMIWDVLRHRQEQSDGTGS